MGFINENSSSSSSCWHFPHSGFRGTGSDVGSGSVAVEVPEIKILMPWRNCKPLCDKVLAGRQYGKDLGNENASSGWTNRFECFKEIKIWKPMLSSRLRSDRCTEGRWASFLSFFAESFGLGAGVGCHAIDIDTVLKQGMPAPYIVIVPACTSQTCWTPPLHTSPPPTFRALKL